MRRFIDVVFVEPIHKYYVVLHQGNFWQLPRLNLTTNSWALRVPYTGKLSDIFVAKDQALACEQLAETLSTFELPKELHSLDALRFLDWWSMNDYKWLSQQNVVSLGNDTDDDLVLDFSIDTPKPTITPTPTPTPKNSTSAQAVQQPTPQSTKSTTASATQAPPKAQPKPTQPKPTPNPSASPNQAPQMADKDKAKTDDLDIFDNLLHELNEEVLYPNR